MKMKLPLAVVGIIALSACSATTEPSASSKPSAVPSNTPTEEAVAEISPAEELSVYAKLGISVSNAIIGDDTCLPAGEYTAFDEDNLQGVVKDAAGVTVGIGTFGDIEVQEGGCARTFLIDVPAGSGFYTLEVGDWTSDTYAEADIKRTGMTIVADLP